MRDLLINLMASVIAGAAVWLAQRAVRRRRLARERAFFGLTAGGDCLLSVARHFSSPRKASVHRRDVAALVELATLARECGARADLANDGALAQGFGRLTEFCVGGPGGNPRTATHLRTILRGVTFVAAETIAVGGVEYHFEPGVAEYVVLARAWGPARDRPVFVLAGQTAPTNLAAARYLAARNRPLFRQFGPDRQFCLILRIVEPAVYGADFVELVADVTEVAFHPPAVG
ncbi:MAG TPA: hypothetical protein VGP57_25070 [Actinoplanes sp.]|nr:hypothetical protein [Actinoplanes sp.]